MGQEYLLSVKDLHIHYVTRDMGVCKAVNGVGFNLAYGETLGLVGETGAGKTTIARGIMRLVSEPPGKIMGGEIWFKDENLLTLPIKKMRKYRGDKISMIFQDPMTSLDPTMPIGKQIMENLIAHRHMSKAEAKTEAIEMLRRVGIPEPEKRFSEYPHQFSGGMRQRVMIAIAFACDPNLLICDEPTTALDVTIQSQILDIIKELQREHNTSVIMITHDLGVVANIAQSIVVMYSGMIVERGTCEDIFYRARHPYTWALIDSVPRLDLKNKQELASIPGIPPDLLNPPKGCPFSTRCKYCMSVCKREMPPFTDFGGGHTAACWLHHPMAPKVEMPDRVPTEATAEDVAGSKEVSR